MRFAQGANKVSSSVFRVVEGAFIARAGVRWRRDARRVATPTSAINKARKVERTIAIGKRPTARVIEA